MSLATEEAFANRVDDHGADEHHGDERVGERVAPNIFEAIKNLHRDDAWIVKNERHAKLGEGPDENDGAAGEEAGIDERQRDLEEAPETGATKVLGGFLHRRINVGEGGGGVEIDDGVERKGVDEGDAKKRTHRKPVVGPAFGAEMQVNEQGVERTILSEDLLDPDRADKWRQDHRNKHDGAEQAFAGKMEAVAHEGQRQGDEKRCSCRRACEQEGVSNAAQIDRLYEQCLYIGDREMAVGVDEAAF